MRQLHFEGHHWGPLDQKRELTTKPAMVCDIPHLDAVFLRRAYQTASDYRHAATSRSIKHAEWDSKL